MPLEMYSVQKAFQCNDPPPTLSPLSFRGSYASLGQMDSEMGTSWTSTPTPIVNDAAATVENVAPHGFAPLALVYGTPQPV